MLGLLVLVGLLGLLAVALAPGHGPGGEVGGVDRRLLLLFSAGSAAVYPLLVLLLIVWRQLTDPPGRYQYWGDSWFALIGMGPWLLAISMIAIAVFPARELLAERREATASEGDSNPAADDSRGGPS